MSRAMKYPERNAEILRRRDAGEWPTQIAKAMGIGRNAVIGVCNRGGRQSADVDRSAVLRLFAARGESHGCAKLTASEVAAIRREYQPHHPQFSQTALAERYGVSQQTVCKIINNLIWVAAQ